MTPIRILYGPDPPLIRFGTGVPQVASVKEDLQSRDAILAELKHHLTWAQEKMKAKADGKPHNVQFVVGDMVYLKLQPYQQQSLAIRRNEKLAPCYYVPYVVAAQIGPMAYKL